MTATENYLPRWWSPEDAGAEGQSSSASINRLGLQESHESFRLRYARLLRLALSYPAAHAYIELHEHPSVFNRRSGVERDLTFSGFEELGNRFITAISLSDLEFGNDDSEDFPRLMGAIPRNPKIIFETIINFRDGDLPKQAKRVTIDPRFFETEDD